MRNSSPVFREAIISLILSLVLGALISLFQPGLFMNSWIAASSILWGCSFVMIRVWKSMGGGRALAILMAITFFTRLVLGIVLHQVLPRAGFDTEVQRAGYVYADAYERDQTAWQLATGSDPLWQVWTKDVGSDQYGGLLFLSVLVYRVLSTDVARPILITLLAAFAMSVGLAFLYAALRDKWSTRFVLAAGWFYALYPEGLLLGSSQMREPFLIGFFCLGLWAVLSSGSRKSDRLAAFLVAVPAATAFSIPAGLAIAAVLVIIGIILKLAAAPGRKQATLLWAGLIAIIVAAVVAGWLWLKPTLYYDAYLTETNSGLISMLLKQIGDKWRIPFVAVYGLAQPVLPAAITDPSLPIWMILSIWRGLGWYFTLPFLLYIIVVVWKTRPASMKWLIMISLGIFLVWVAVSSMRAGGDQWDNPRYRAIFLPLLAVLFAWAIRHHDEERNAWFWVFQALVWIDVLLFTLWYLPRRGYWGISMPFFTMVLLVGAVSLVFLLIGLTLTFKKSPKPLKG